MVPAETQPNRPKASKGNPFEAFGLSHLGPLTLLYPLAFMVGLIPAAGPISDRDAYWHVLVGDEIRSTRDVVGAGDAWAWYDPPTPWTTSQWMSEVVMSGTVQTTGWIGLVALTLALATATLLLLAWVIAQRASPIAAPLLFFGLAASLALFFQTRPLLVSYLGSVAVAHLADRTLREGRLPAWWFYPLVALWANLHGQWFIAPTAIAVAAGLHWLAAPASRGRFALRALAAVALTVLAGSLSPLGFRGVLLPLQFRGATDHISEWQVTQLWSISGIPMVIVVGLILVSWARSRTNVPWWEIAYVAVWTGFGLLAFRNAPVAALMLAPLAASRASHAFAGHGRTTSDRERRLLPPMFVVTCLASAGFLTSVLVSTDALASAEPLQIARYMDENDLSGRVLNAYNASGVLVAFGPPGVELGVDGRAERYGAEYISQYLDVLRLSGDRWPAFLDDFAPEVAVVESDAAIRHLLEDDWRWRVVMADGSYILLTPKARG